MRLLAAVVVLTAAAFFGQTAPTHLTANVVPAGPVIPANAIAVTGLQTASWGAAADPGAGGSASGSSTLIASPSLSGAARQFQMAFTEYGGELFHLTFGNDAEVTHFVYGASVYLPASADLANLELDMNQVLADGETVIFGFQCDGWSGTWDYTANSGTAAMFDDIWVHSSQPCNPRQWTLNTWHRVEIAYTRSVGNVTYESVWLDGVEYPINATVFSGFALGWPVGTLLINFQMDGLGVSGESAAVLDDVAVWRW